MTTAEYLRSAEEFDYEIMEEHRRRVEELVADPAKAEILKPYYRYLCKRPCFHDEYLPAFNNPNVTLVDCPAGIERITEQGPVVDGKQYEVDCIIYGTGFEAELTPLYRRAGHEIVGRGGVTLAEKWADGAASLFGMMSRGFPNMFVMPAPGQQAVVTVNYTQLAVLGAEFVGAHRRAARATGRGGVRRERRGRGGVDAEDRRLLRRRQRRHVGLHAVAHQQRGPSRGDEPPQRQLRPRVGRLVRLPRAARAVARGRHLRGPGDRGPVDGVVSGRQRVAVVTGGGGGIGAAIAEELGRVGWFVVTVDPLVTLDGTERLPEPEETTAGRIVAAGGSARASSASVTDGEAVRALFRELADEHGGLDAVVNVAGITRQTYFAHGTEEDWLAVLAVHLGGYLNVLDAALPLMAAAGHGRVLGVTSGSGWRPADAGAYSCAKRAVAALTWQLGRTPPPGVTVNAISPIAATRMVAAAARACPQGGPDRQWRRALALRLDARSRGPRPRSAHTSSVTGSDGAPVRSFFAGGSEIAVVDEPRLLEVVRSDEVVSLAGVLETVIPRAFAKAETSQSSGGGGNPRFGPIFEESGSRRARTDRGATPVPSSPTAHDWPRRSSPRSRLARSPATASRSPTASHEAADALRAVVESASIDAVVVAPAGHQSTPSRPDGWERVLAEHHGITEGIHTDAGWCRAAADYAAGADRPLRLVTLTDAATAGGRSRAQASAQFARVAAGVDRRARHGVRGEHRSLGGRCGRTDRRTRRPPARSPRGNGSRRCGAGGRCRLARAPQSPSTDRQHHLRRSRRPRLVRRAAT